jgi:hypothetical protein
MSQLESRLQQLYDDLEPFANKAVGYEVAEVYNDLYKQVMNDRSRLVGMNKVDHETDARTVRLLVGQLRLIAGA